MYLDGKYLREKIVFQIVMLVELYFSSVIWQMFLEWMRKKLCKNVEGLTAL